MLVTGGLWERVVGAWNTHMWKLLPPVLGYLTHHINRVQNIPTIRGSVL